MKNQKMSELKQLYLMRKSNRIGRISEKNFYLKKHLFDVLKRAVEHRHVIYLKPTIMAKTGLLNLQASTSEGHIRGCLHNHGREDVTASLLLRSRQQILKTHFCPC